MHLPLALATFTALPADKLRVGRSHHRRRSPSRSHMRSVRNRRRRPKGREPRRSRVGPPTIQTKAGVMRSFLERRARCLAHVCVQANRKANLCVAGSLAEIHPIVSAMDRDRRTLVRNSGPRWKLLEEALVQISSQDGQRGP